MAPWLNRKSYFFLQFLFLVSIILGQQNGKETPVYREYKDSKQFDDFYKKRNLVGAWQIHQLKKGALVVKLKTNQPLIDALLKKGDKRTAEKKRIEALAININICKAFRDKYTFSRLYFIYSNYQDSLLEGGRSNIFLDSNLTIDSKITMSETFYLISETDNVYNSSIGFIAEDSARFAIERGSPTLTKVPIVIKNKFGHQLKRPFPFCFGDGIRLSKNIPLVYVSINGKAIPFYVNGNDLGEPSGGYIYEGKPLMLTIPKSFTYTWLLLSVEDLNRSLENFYKAASMPDTKKIESVKPFLY